MKVGEKLQEATPDPVIISPRIVKSRRTDLSFLVNRRPVRESSLFRETPVGLPSIALLCAHGYRHREAVLRLALRSSAR